VSGLYYEAASMMLPGGLCYWQAKLIKLLNGRDLWAYPPACPATRAAWTIRNPDDKPDSPAPLPCRFRIPSQFAPEPQPLAPPRRDAAKASVGNEEGASIVLRETPRLFRLT